MSQYLIGEIEYHPRIRVQSRTRVAAASGEAASVVALVHRFLAPPG